MRVAIVGKARSSPPLSLRDISPRSGGRHKPVSVATKSPPPAHGGRVARSAGWGQISAAPTKTLRIRKGGIAFGGVHGAAPIRRRQTALNGSCNACKTFCHGVTAPPHGSTISDSAPARFAASTSVKSLSPNIAVCSGEALARSMAARIPRREGLFAWP